MAWISIWPSRATNPNPRAILQPRTAPIRTCELVLKSVARGRLQQRTISAQTSEFPQSSGRPMSPTDKYLLIISSFFEPNVNHVIKELERRGVGWRRFNTESFPLLCQG